MQVNLVNGYRARLPLSRFPPLARASTEQRDDWKLEGAGSAVRWTSLDLTLTREQLLDSHG